MAPEAAKSALPRAGQLRLGRRESRKLLKVEELGYSEMALAS